VAHSVVKPLRPSIVIITIINEKQHYTKYNSVKVNPLTPPPWAAALTSRRDLIPSEPSASAERATGRLSAAQLARLVWSLADSHRVVRNRLVLGFWGWLMGPHCGLSLRGCFVQTCPL